MIDAMVFTGGIAFHNEFSTLNLKLPCLYSDVYVHYDEKKN